MHITKEYCLKEANISKYLLLDVPFAYTTEWGWEKKSSIHLDECHNKTKFRRKKTQSLMLEAYQKKCNFLLFDVKRKMFVKSNRNEMKCR